MLKRMLSLLTGLAMIGLPLSASDKKETDRLQNCGTVLKEILDIPDDIPQDLIDKAECLIVFPSVLKAAFVIGGSYGRGAMTCRTGEHFTGPWSAPTMMALEGGSIGLQLGGQATDFVLLVMNPRGARAILCSKVKLGAYALESPAHIHTPSPTRVCEFYGPHLALLATNSVRPPERSRLDAGDNMT